MSKHGNHNNSSKGTFQMRLSLLVTHDATEHAMIFCNLSDHLLTHSAHNREYTQVIPDPERQRRHPSRKGTKWYRSTDVERPRSKTSPKSTKLLENSIYGKDYDTECEWSESTPVSRESRATGFVVVEYIVQILWRAASPECQHATCEPTSS